MGTSTWCMCGLCVYVSCRSVVLSLSFCYSVILSFCHSVMLSLSLSLRLCFADPSPVLDTCHHCRLPRAVAHPGVRETSQGRLEAAAARVQWPSQQQHGAGFHVRAGVVVRGSRCALPSCWCSGVVLTLPCGCRSAEARAAQPHCASGRRRQASAAAAPHQARGAVWDGHSRVPRVAPAATDSAGHGRTCCRGSPGQGATVCCGSGCFFFFFFFRCCA